MVFWSRQNDVVVKPTGGSRKLKQSINHPSKIIGKRGTQLFSWYYQFTKLQLADGGRVLRAVETGTEKWMKMEIRISKSGKTLYLNTDRFRVKDVDCVLVSLDEDEIITFCSSIREQIKARRSILRYKVQRVWDTGDHILQRLDTKDYGAWEWIKDAHGLSEKKGRLMVQELSNEELSGLGMNFDIRYTGGSTRVMLTPSEGFLLWLFLAHEKGTVPLPKEIQTSYSKCDESFSCESTSALSINAWTSTNSTVGGEMGEDSSVGPIMLPRSGRIIEDKLRSESEEELDASEHGSLVWEVKARSGISLEDEGDAFEFAIDCLHIPSKLQDTTMSRSNMYMRTLEVRKAGCHRDRDKKGHRKKTCCGFRSGFCECVCCVSDAYSYSYRRVSLNAVAKEIEPLHPAIPRVTAQRTKQGVHQATPRKIYTKI